MQRSTYTLTEANHAFLVEYARNQRDMSTSLNNILQAFRLEVPIIERLERLANRMEHALTERNRTNG